jgi:hypothetical protein
MSKSFEDKLREKLSAYQAQPPADAKKAILGNTASGSFLSGFFNVTGVVLLVIALFMTGYEFGTLRLSHNLKTGDFEPIEFTVEPQNVNMVHVPKRKFFNQRESEVKVQNPVIIHESEGIDDNQILLANDQEEQFSFDYTAYFVDGFGYDLTNESHFPEITFVRKQRNRKEVVPQRKKNFFTLYVDGGAFFLYNRLQPNLEDDIYVGNYDAPFSISAARIGASLVVGLQRDWNEKLTSRIGLIYNNYNQNFSFTARHNKPDSIIVKEDLIEPVFDEQDIQIRKRISTVGLKFQNIWSFPSQYNSLYFSAEYQRRIGQGAIFQFDSEMYELSNPDAWLLEFGMRKKLADMRKGNFYVIPSIRYAVSKIGDQGILNVKPFSVGVSLSYSLK